MNNTVSETNSLLSLAFRNLNLPRYILSPMEEATVSFPAFNPFRAGREIIAKVEWPAINTLTMKDVVLVHLVRDGDSL